MPMGIGLGLTFTLTAGTADFLASMADGFVFDFTKTDRHFQESVGPTLADDVTDPIGLALENRQWGFRTLAQELATQAELVTNGTFDVDASGWTAFFGTTSIVSGKVRITTTDATFPARISQPITCVIGKTYAISAERITGTSAPILAVALTASAVGSAILNVSNQATNTLYFVATQTTHYVMLVVGTPGVGLYSDFDNISVKEIPTHHGVQSSSSLRGARAVFNGYSDDQPELLVPGDWIMSVAGGASTAVESPDGTLTLVCVGSDAARGDQSFATVSGRNYRISAKNAGPNLASVNIGTTQGGAEILNAGAIPAGTMNVFNVVATGSTIWVRFLRAAGGSFVVSEITAKEVPASRIATGIKFDGSDDNHLTTYKASSGPNFIVAYVNVPTTLSAVQIVAGANEAASANRFFLAFNTSGQLCGGVGSESDTTILSTATDWRGKSAVFGLSFDGTTVRLFADSTIVYEAAQSGAPTTTIPFRIGSNNADGSAGSFFAGTIENVIAGPEYLNLARYLQIRNDLINQ